MSLGVKSFDNGEWAYGNLHYDKDCLAQAIERLEAAGLPVVFHVHDEVVIDCQQGAYTLEDVVKLMAQPMKLPETITEDQYQYIKANKDAERNKSPFDE